MGLLYLMGESAFNPRTLFSNNEQGLWLDPSQMATMYQDSNGVTPCTAAGDPVGLILDQSRGGLGAQGAELVTNGGFTSDVSGWTNVGSGTFVWSSGSGLFTRTTFTDNASQSLSTTSGRFYLISFNVVSGSNARVAFNTSATVGSVIAENVGVGTYSRIVQATSTTMYIVLSASANVAIEYDNISIREVPGNHAYQTTSASRPTLARIPSSGRRNLLTRTEEFDNAAWTKTSSTVTAGVSDPNGGSTAWTLTATGASGLVRQSISGLSGSLSNSIWIRRRTGTGVVRFYTGAASSTQQMQSVITSDWQRLSTTPGTATGTGDQFGVICETSGDAVDIWRPQLETGSTATNYQKVAATTDVTESGVSDLWHLVFDGSDDSLVTNAVDFSATDEMTVIAGVRKLSDAASGMVAELSATASSNAGSFNFLSPRANGEASLAFTLNGGSALNLRSYTGLAAPRTDVISATLDTTAADSAAAIAVRLNGAPTTGTEVVTAASTGNFGSHVLNIGRRNQASIPFNGHIYQLIIRGKTTPTGKLLEAERFVARKTGVSF